MQFVEKRVYAGSPNEVATVDTTEQNGGAVTVRLDGVLVAEDVQFPLEPLAGGERRLEIGLVGATGAFCVVGISTVDGATDPDLLLCTSSTPAPVHVYRFLTTPSAAMAAMARAAGPVPAAPVGQDTPPGPTAPAPAAPRAPRKAAKRRAKRPAKRIGKPKGGR